MNRMEDMVVITVKAAMMVGMIISMAEPISRQRQEKIGPLAGTWCGKPAERWGDPDLGQTVKHAAGGIDAAGGGRGDRGRRRS